MRSGTLCVPGSLSGSHRQHVATHGSDQGCDQTNQRLHVRRGGCAGTVSQVELVYGTREQHLFMAEGYYDGPLLPRRVTGRCVLLLTSAFSQDTQQRPFVSNRLDVFVQLDNVGAEIVAKTLHPLMGRTIDRNFAESARFVGQVSHVAETNGPGVQRLVSRLDNVEPSVRTQFAQITSTMNQRAALRNLGSPEEESAQRLSDRRNDEAVRTMAEK